jgi:hypothetical protein
VSAPQSQAANDTRSIKEAMVKEEEYRRKEREEKEKDKDKGKPGNVTKALGLAGMGPTEGLALAGGLLYAAFDDIKKIPERLLALFDPEIKWLQKTLSPLGDVLGSVGGIISKQYDALKRAFPSLFGDEEPVNEKGIVTTPTAEVLSTEEGLEKNKLAVLQRGPLNVRPEDYSADKPLPTISALGYEEVERIMAARADRNTESGSARMFYGGKPTPGFGGLNLAVAGAYESDATVAEQEAQGGVLRMLQGGQQTGVDNDLWKSSRESVEIQRKTLEVLSSRERVQRAPTNGVIDGPNPIMTGFSGGSW